MTAKHILQLQQAQLAMMKKNGSQNQIDFYSWFIKNSEHFHLVQVDKRLSEKTAIAIDAQIKECYHNTWLTLVEDRKLKYYEGFVWNKSIPIPIEHSWLITKQGKLIDPTLIIKGERLKQQLKEYNLTKAKVRNRLGDEYMGINIPTDTVMSFAIKSGYTGGFLIEYWMMQRGEPRRLHI